MRVKVGKRIWLKRRRSKRDSFPKPSQMYAIVPSISSYGTKQCDNGNITIQSLRELYSKME
ncbi:hypothetical protein DOY81_004614 [Sarcophaga bullata]|nr:hypothetical protein DOY81_004614 [Sarcophaga bullata]